MKPLLALLLALLLASCSSLRLAINSHALEDFQQAIATQEFKQAEQIAAQLPKSHAQYDAVQQALPTLRQAEQKYADKALRSARKLADSQHLQAAIELLANTQDTLPNPADTLQQLRDQLRQQQLQQISQQQAQLLTSEAEWLLDQRANLAALASQQQRPEAQRQAQLLQQRQPQLAQQLVALGNHFAKQQHWQDSYHCLSLAQQLGANPFPEDTLKQARNHLQRAQRQRLQQRRKQQQQEADERIAHYQKSQLMADLLRARDYVQSHNHQDSLQAQEATVSKLSQQRFDHDIHLGDTLYASGHYQSAARIWRRLAPLYPNNGELAKKLERVDKVLHSINTLKPH